LPWLLLASTGQHCATSKTSKSIIHALLTIMNAYPSQTSHRSKAARFISVPWGTWMRETGLSATRHRPLLGRYPGDVYDGDTDEQTGVHPWAVSTANFAELYYRLAKQITTTGTIPLDELSANFFSQIAINTDTTPAAAVAALQRAADQMLQALVFHSDHLELSEQFDATTGYEKSVSNLSWSYASFLSAVRAKNAWVRPPSPNDRRNDGTLVALPFPLSAEEECVSTAESRQLLQPVDEGRAGGHGYACRLSLGR
jgi:hypothetical protein